MQHLPLYNQDFQTNTVEQCNSFNIKCCIQVQDSLEKAILLNAAFMENKTLSAASMVWREGRCLYIVYFQITVAYHRACFS